MRTHTHAHAHTHTRTHAHTRGAPDAQLRHAAPETIERITFQLYQAETACAELGQARQEVKEWQAKAELNIKEKELLQDEQHRVLAAMQKLHAHVHEERLRRSSEQEEERSRLVEARASADALQAQVLKAHETIEDMQRVHSRELTRLRTELRECQLWCDQLRNQLLSSKAALQAHVRGLNGPLHHTLSSIEAVLRASSSTVNPASPEYARGAETAVVADAGGRGRGEAGGCGGGQARARLPEPAMSPSPEKRRVGPPPIVPPHSLAAPDMTLQRFGEMYPPSQELPQDSDAVPESDGGTPDSLGD